jgi:organic radical activating enzyme
MRMPTLRVIEIFDSLQGEGYWTGVPMTFVRLAGCNAAETGLGCAHWCDTPGSWSAGAGEELDVSEIVEQVCLPRLCLTGGEPLLQSAGVVALVAQAHGRGIKVHLETNGTLPPPVDTAPLESTGDLLFDWAVVSPKPPDHFVAPEWEGLVDELKLVVDEGLGAATAERLAARHPGAIISIQPLWEDAALPPEFGRSPGEAAAPDQPSRLCLSERRAIALVMEHPGWRLSLQTHKYLGLR